MSVVIRKFKTLVRGIRQRGLVGFLRYYLRESDNGFVGRLVVLRGNHVSIDGLTIHTDSPAVPLINKSQLLQGRYERPERDAVRLWLDPSLPVIELGGSIGVVACLTNRRLQDPRRHVVVEADPAMAETLNRNRAANGCQFDIVNRAVAYSGESIRFNRHGFSSSIYAVSDSSISVPTTTLQTISQQAGFETFTLICDIEGAEHDLFEHEAPLIKQSVTLIIIELHPFIRGQAEVDQLQTFIRNLGFEQLHQDEQIFVYRNTALS